MSQEVPTFKQATPEGRFVSLGPYYAMFPVSFVQEAFERFCTPGAVVMDPFCGRGTAPFVAGALGHQAYGYDINPVAYVFAKAKAAPARFEDAVARVREIGVAVRNGDEVPENEFQAWCWAPNVLAFLRAARRELKWLDDPIDATVMACLLVVLHAKERDGISNQIRQAKAMSPDYSVRWWKQRGMPAPAKNPVEFLISRMEWRYAKGTPNLPGSVSITLGDSASNIASTCLPPVRFVLTSPPYAGITDYRYDNWIRLWLMGEGPLPRSEGKALKYDSEPRYKVMMEKVFGAVATACAPDARLVVRTDKRTFTLTTTLGVIRQNWPDHAILARHQIPKRSQTALFNASIAQVGEVDLLVVPREELSGIQANDFGCVEEIISKSAA